MAQDQSGSTDRRAFLQAGALATASAVTVTAGAHAQQTAAPAAAAKPKTLPTRPLGKTGANITMLNQGAVRGGNTDTLLRISYAAGVRTFDTAKVYGSEPNFKKWFQAMPEVRKEIFLVTKDELRTDTAAKMPALVDERLEACGTDFIDLFFIHGLGDYHTVDEAVTILKSKEFRASADKVRASGKAKLIGFSIHCKDRAPIIQAAAECGAIDALMVMYNPWIEKDSPLNKALDACHEKGIGLISMKQTAGKFAGDGVNKEKAMAEVVKRLPMLAEKKLSPFQGLLTAIWTDERISSVCTSMRNRDEIRENVDAAHRFAPLKFAEIEALKDAVIDNNPMLCADCDGRCSVAANTTAELGNLTRFLTYHEHHGDRVEARRQYAALAPEARDWSGADLEAAREACPNKLNFAKLLPRVDRHLA